jgi:hypothetical protein
MEQFKAGVGSGPRTFEKDSDGGWILEFGKVGNKHVKGKWVFDINWATLRYREIVDIDNSSVTYLGGCEAIKH